MEIKRFNLNEDRHDGAKILPRVVLQKVSALLDELRNFNGSYLSSVFENPEFENAVNSWSCHYKIPVSNQYENDVYKYVESVKEKYELEVERPYLIFNTKEGSYKIPLNVNMSSSNMIYDEEDKNNLTYSVWINTYVAQKI